jgi:hypothetical protein
MTLGKKIMSNAFYYFIISSILFTSLQSQAVWSKNSFFEKCDRPYTDANAICSIRTNSQDCQRLANNCVSGCAYEDRNLDKMDDQDTSKSFNSSERPVAATYKTQCEKWGGAISATSSTASQKCQNSQSLGDWEACSTECAQAANEAANSQDRNRYESMASACKNKMTPEPQDPTDDLTDDDGEPLDPSDDDTNSDETTTTADTGSPNPNLQNMMGIQPPQSGPILNPGGVDFTNGINSDVNRFSEAVGGVSGALGFNSQGVPPVPPIDDMVGLNEATSNSGGAAAGGVGGLGGGAGGGGGGMMGAASAPGRSGGGAGGAGAQRTSLAGSQLNKVGQNTFWSGGGGGSSGGAGSGRNTATTGALKKEKVKKVPYNSKGLGDGGLLRLFGNGLKSGLNGTSGSCGDTVFCPMENFFYTIDRHPNSDIKSTDAK